jgi:hypothetical protein
MALGVISLLALGAAGAPLLVGALRRGPARRHLDRYEPICGRSLFTALELHVFPFLSGGRPVRNPRRGRNRAHGHGAGDVP